VFKVEINLFPSSIRKPQKIKPTMNETH